MPPRNNALGAATSPDNFRAGFVTFVGRPNVGKSSLTNALVGEKVAITSPKPQTTRHTLRGIVQREDGQIIIVDTPGMHRPRTLLGERLNALVQATLGDVDVIGFCLPAGEKIGPGDRFIVEQVQGFRAKKVAVVTKTDLASPAQIAEQLLAVTALADWDLVIPVSAQTGDQVAALADEILALLPLSEPLYDTDVRTDEEIEDRIAELIREAALEGVRDELPHSIATLVDEMVEREDGLLEIYASIFVERDSQKGIILGKGASRLRSVGERARSEIEPLLGRRVFLSLRVKVAKDWQRDAKQLRKLGF